MADLITEGLSNPVYQSRAVEIADRIHQEDGIGSAVAIIRKQLGS